MSREQLDKEIEATLEQNRAAIERARNYGRDLEWRVAVSEIRMDRIFRELRQALQR